MTSAAGTVTLQSSTHHDELLCSKWAEAHVSGYGNQHRHGHAIGYGYLPLCGHGPGPMYTPLRLPVHGHEHEHEHEHKDKHKHSLCISVDASQPKNDIRRHGLHNFASSYINVDASEPKKDTQRHDGLRNFTSLDVQVKPSFVQHRDIATMDKGRLIELIQRYIHDEDLDAGRQLHGHVVTNGMHLDEHVGSHLIHMFSSMGSLLEARQVFNDLPTPNAFSWSAIISAHAKHGHLDQALDLYYQMMKSTVQPDSHVFVAILEACSESVAISRGRLIHTDIVQCGYSGHLHVCNVLIAMYSRCGSIEDACLVFQCLPKADVVTWNTLLTSYVKSGRNTEALQLFEQMRSSGAKPDRITYVCVLKACCGRDQLEQGRIIHCHIMENGVELDFFLGSSLIEMYCRCDNFTAAFRTFHRLKTQDAALWNTIMSMYSQHGKAQQAIGFLQSMQAHSIEPDWNTLVWCLNAFLEMASIKEGKLLHACIVKKGMEAAALVGRMLVDMYFRCGSLEQARTVFNGLPTRDVTAWSTLIRGYFESGHNQEAFDCLNEMQEDGILPDQLTYVCILKGCANLAALGPGQKVHSLTVATGFEIDLVVGNNLVVMYNRCGCLEDARAIFDRLPERDVITWNAMIDGYTKHGFVETALDLYNQMCRKGMQPNLVTFVCTLKACSAMRNIEQGRQLHAQLIGRGIELDPIIGNSLLDMYSKCGSFEDALFLFDGLSKKAVITWNTLIAGYSLHQCGRATLDLFRRMQIEGLKPDSITFVCVLKACLSLLDLEQGKEIHAHIVKNGLEMDIYIGNILISMYGHCGSMEDAHRVFDLMKEKDVVTWSALMTGYTHSGLGKEVLQIFEKMWFKDIKPDEAAFVCALKACSETAALEQGRTLHGHAVEKGCELNPPISSTLITMYGKCGNLNMACLVFNKSSRQSVVTYNAMLAVFGEHGQCRSSFQLFESMTRAGMKPTNITFICLLSACRSLELVDEGCYQFTLMHRNYGIVPEAEHYGCMVDILGKAGLVDEAEDLLETIPLASNIVGWTSLLSSCNRHFDINRGERCFDGAVNIDPANTAVYVLMSKLYKSAGLHKNAQEVESLRKHGNKWKKPGRAYIEINKKVHEFVVGDKTHPQIDKIQLKVKALGEKITERIHMPHPNLANLPISNEDKGDNLCGHSEKLAIAFGLMSTDAGTTIRVAKNIRMCADCHRTSRLTSLIENREIIISDSYCVHNFRDGACSCKE
eukprot:c5373_g1_i1 orf=98-3787(+)